MVKETPAAALKAMIDAGEPFEFIDVRTPQEREYASIPGTTLLDQATYDRLLQLDPDTTLVFHCHHGVRSRQVAWHFAQQGFTDVHNVADGIEGWSVHVDPAVPRY